MKTLAFGDMVVDIEKKDAIRNSEDLNEDARPSIRINFKSGNEILHSVRAWSLSADKLTDEELKAYVGEFVIGWRNIALGGKYHTLFQAVGTKALETGRGDLLLEPIFTECGMVKRDNEYILPIAYCTCGQPFNAPWETCECGLHYPVKEDEE